jgi:hypothetical protein
VGGNGGAGQGGGLFAGSSTQVTLTNGSFSSNSAIGGAGGAFLKTTKTTPSAAAQGGEGSGGGLYATGSQLNLSDVSLSHNTAEGGTGGAGSSNSNSRLNGAQGGDGRGGGIYLAGGTSLLQTLQLTGNEAVGGAGGAGGNSSSSGSGGDGGNGGNARGGGLFLAGSATVSLTGSSLSGNQAVGGAGGPGANAEYEGGEGGDGGEAYGGALSAACGKSLQVSLSGDTIAGNTAIGGQGGNAGSGSSSATAGGSGGDGLGGGLFASGGTWTLTNVTVAQNTATGGDGGNGGNASSGQAGAGGDAGDGRGGGIFASGGTWTLTNTTVGLNQAAAGTPRNAGTGSLSASPGASGEAQGGGIYNSSGTVNLLNTLVAENTAADAGPDLDGAFVSQGNNLIGNGAGSTGLTNGVKNDQVGPSPSVVPGLASSVQNNGGLVPTLALLPGSTAIDRGNNAAEATTGPYDARGPGFDRIIDNVIDIGAYEVQPPAPVQVSDPTSSIPALALGLQDYVLGGQLGFIVGAQYFLASPLVKQQALDAFYQALDEAQLMSPAAATAQLVEENGLAITLASFVNNPTAVNVPQFEAQVMAEALQIAGNPLFQDPSGLGVGLGALAAELDLASSIDNSSGDQAALRALGIASVTF